MAIRARRFQRARSNAPIDGADPQAFTNPSNVIRWVRGHAHPEEDILNAIARLCNIRVEYRPLNSDESGSLMYSNKTEQWTVTINSLHHPKRQRFTLAHELAHYFLHRNENQTFSDAVFFRADHTQNRMEYEANNFAGALLMPKDDFIEYIRTQSNSIEQISNHFNVSAMAVKVRADVIKGRQYDF